MHPVGPFPFYVLAKRLMGAVFLDSCRHLKHCMIFRMVAGLSHN